MSTSLNPPPGNLASDEGGDVFGIRATIRKAREARATSPLARAGTVLIIALAGFMITVSALASAGKDLRPNRSTDLVELVRSQAKANQEMAAELSKLREEVDGLSARRVDGPDLRPKLEAASANAGLTPVQGPGVQVTLTDAPLDVKPVGVASDLLVVHEQDIHAVINALWAGGAEAMMVQGVRVTTTTGIKCVGNSVVIKGVPYAPPYVITAIGDPDALMASLANSEPLRIYQQYVRAYQLGYDQRRLDHVQMPGYEGSVDMKWAKTQR